MEMCGEVLGSRFQESITEEFEISCALIIHLIDSMIVQAQIQKEIYCFKSFVPTRLSEIRAFCLLINLRSCIYQFWLVYTWFRHRPRQKRDVTCLGNLLQWRQNRDKKLGQKFINTLQKKTNPSKWLCIPSDQNPVDLTTHITNLIKLKEHLMWQRGSEFFNQSWEIWSIRKDQNKSNEVLPDNIITVIYISTNKNKTIIDTCSIITDNLRDYKTLGLPADWTIWYQLIGVMMNDQGIIVVGKRLANWIKSTWNKTPFPLLPRNRLFTRLFLSSIQQKEHTGIEFCISYWILYYSQVRKCHRIVRRRIFLLKAISIHYWKARRFKF